jgi:hypothetical protein
MVKPADKPIHQIGRGQFAHISEGASVVIGSLGSPDGDFIPQLRASRWDNEAWLKVRAIGVIPDKKQPTFAGGIIDHPSKRNGKTEIHRFVEGSTKWEIVWERRNDLPDGPWLEFAIDAPTGLAWHYQPPLTPQEIAEGCYRPDNIVGSYVSVWPRSGRFVYNTGEEIVNYQTGKFAHLYRPEFIDGAGRRLWGVQKLLADPLRLQIQMPPQAWLAESVFPLTLDPTFGYGTGGSVSLTTNRTTCLVHADYCYTAVAGAQITALTFGGRGTANKLGIYEVTSANAGNKLASAAVSGGAVDAEYTVTLDPDWDLTAGTSYGVAIFVGTSGRVYYDSLAGTRREYQAGDFPSPMGGSTDGATVWLYATYTAPAPTTKARIIGGGII